MDMLLRPAYLKGEVRAIASKSAAHRALILSALADSATRIVMPGQPPADILATAGCIEALGTNVEWREWGAEVCPVKIPPDQPLLHCGESGSTLRFMLPVAAALSGGFTVMGGEGLARRPIVELCRAMESGGCTVEGERLPIRVRGRLRAGEYALPGNVSSQYISGLLMALPLMEGRSGIRLTSPLESGGYVDMTIAAMRKFGAAAEIVGNGFASAGGGYRSPGRIEIEGDWSAAAFWLGAKALGHDIDVLGLDERSAQPDKQVVRLLGSLGNGAVLDMSQHPDLFPILAVRAAYSDGETRFVNGGRLRIKESDRLSAIAKGLAALGGDVQEGPDWLMVRGKGLRGGTVQSCGDHRIAMAWAIAALNGREPVRVTDAEAVNKSYPGFWQEYERLGGNCHVV